MNPDEHRVEGLSSSLRSPAAGDSLGVSEPNLSAPASRLHRVATPKLVGCAVLLWLVTLGLYSPVIGFDFVAFDDGNYVSDNPDVQGGLSLRGALWALTSTHASNWHPVTWWSHQLDAQLFGPGPAGPHAVNALLHAFNSVLVFLLFTRWTGRWGAAIWLGAVFALHPLHIESVAWVSERKDVLSAFFFLLTLGAFAEYVHRLYEPTRARRWFVVALAGYALALMSKPMAVTLPFLLLVLDVWPWRRIAPSAVRAWGPLLREKAPFFGLSFACCVITLIAQHSGGAMKSLTGMPLSARLENSAVAYLHYLHQSVWPDRLAVFHPHPGAWPWPTVILALVLITAFSAAAFAARYRCRSLLVGWLWFLGLLVPTIGLVQVGEQAYADRYMYLPLLGLGLMVVGVANHLRDTRPRATWFLGGLACASVVALGARTFHHLPHWRSSEALFTHALHVTKNNYLAHYCLGSAYLDAGQLDAADAQLEAALRLRPDFAAAHNNLGAVQREQHRIDEALHHFRLAAAHHPQDGLARYNLGTTLLDLGQAGDAAVELQEAARLRPRDAVAHLNLGNAYLQLGAPTRAADAYRAALRLAPSSADAHHNLAQALLQLGQVPAAQAHLAQALQAAPAHANTHFTLAEINLAEGRPALAITHFRQALAQVPHDVLGHFGLGTACAALGQNEAAAASFQHALSLQPDFEEARARLHQLTSSVPPAASTALPFLP
jgi:protein O-mannosyl-transferase